MRVSAGTSPVTTEQAKGATLKSLFFGTAVAATLLGATAAHAESFKVGDVDVSVDTTVSLGATMRTSNRSCDHLSEANGGCAGGNGRVTGVNSDNGDLNFDRWDLADAIGRITSDVQLTVGNYGAFVRPTAFYNGVYAKNDLRFRDLNHDGKGQLDYDVNVLDAFVYGKWDVAGHATTLRFGKQALNWGESLFIPGGINGFQAFDVTALRSPGSELKDAMTPMPMIYGSFAASDTVTVEAFWQFSYVRTELDPAGSFFSEDDIVGAGSLPALSNVQPGHDNPDEAIPGGGFVAPGVPSINANVPIALNRTADRGHSDTNQFGAAAHYYAEDVGTGTDFGLYFVRFSSRLPYLGFTNGPYNVATACGALTALGPTCGTPLSPVNQIAFAWAANQGNYFYDFPTINTIGASFSTTVEGTALSGEATFSPHMAFGISDFALNASQLDGTGATTALTGYPGRTTTLDPVGPNASTLSHIDLNAWQGQIGTITSFSTSDFIPRNLGADGGVFVFNAGFVYVPDAGAYPLNQAGSEGGISNAAAAAILANGATNPQYATSFSSGYRAVLSVDYPNAFGTAVTLSPNIAWRHDVLGYSPGPNTANYLKGLKEISVGVEGEYQRYKASLSWTSTFGGGWYNPVTDRDFAMASISYAF